MTYRPHRVRQKVIIIYIATSFAFEFPRTESAATETKHETTNGFKYIMPFDVILTVHRRYYVEIKCQLDATEVFIADLIACSTCFGHHYAHHQELKSIIQWLLPVVFLAVLFQVAGLVWS